MRHKTRRKPYGKLQHYCNGFPPYKYYRKRKNKYYKFSGNLVLASRLPPMRLSHNDILWMGEIDELDGCVLPVASTLAKLIAKGYVKLSFTKEGKDFYENRGKGILIAHALRKLSGKRIK